MRSTSILANRTAESSKKSQCSYLVFSEKTLSLCLSFQWGEDIFQNSKEGQNSVSELLKIRKLEGGLQSWRRFQRYLFIGTKRANARNISSISSPPLPVKYSPNSCSSLRALSKVFCACSSVSRLLRSRMHSTDIGFKKIAIGYSVATWSRLMA